MAMHSLNDILKSKSNSSPLKRGISAANIVEVTNQLLVVFFGPQINDYAKAAYVRGNTLAIACLSSTVAQEIRFKEKQIIAKISEKVPFSTVEKIRYLL